MSRLSALGIAALTLTLGASCLTTTLEGDKGDGGGCPANLSAAKGTTCTTEAQVCGSCPNECLSCTRLVCQGGKWTQQEILPDPGCATDGGNFADAGGGCTWNGEHHGEGDEWAVDDGCNNCRCDHAQVWCTAVICEPGPDTSYSYPDGGSYPRPDGGSYPGPDGGSCPADLESAEGQTCTNEGQICGTCADPCSYCFRLLCQGQIWIKEELIPDCYFDGGTVAGPDGGSVGCTWNGQQYQNGEWWLMGDGCNVCQCDHGQVWCSGVNCSTDGGNFPGPDGGYYYTPDAAEPGPDSGHHPKTDGGHYLGPDVGYSTPDSGDYAGFDVGHYPGPDSGYYAGFDVGHYSGHDGGYHGLPDVGY
jgi:hypothetical protein